MFSLSEDDSWSATELDVLDIQQNTCRNQSTEKKGATSAQFMQGSEDG